MTTETTIRDLTEIAESIDLGELKPYQLELCYIDYRDRYHPDDVEDILRDGYSDAAEEFISQMRWESACDLADELFRGHASDDEYDALADEWGPSDERFHLIELLVERDSSNPERDLLRNTGHMLFRVAPVEDDLPFLDGELNSPVLTLAALGLGREFLPYVKEILPEIEGYRAEGGAHFGATFVFSANPADLVWLGSDAVKVSDPFLWLCNPWSGNGYGTVAKGCTVTLKVDDIHVDEHAWGYSADDVFGGLLLPDSEITAL